MTLRERAEAWLRAWELTDQDPGQPSRILHGLTNLLNEVLEEARERISRMRPSDLTGRGDYDTGHAHGLLNAEEAIRALKEKINAE